MEERRDTPGDDAAGDDRGDDRPIQAAPHKGPSEIAMFIERHGLEFPEPTAFRLSGNHNPSKYRYRSKSKKDPRPKP